MKGHDEPWRPLVRWLVAGSWRAIAVLAREGAAVLPLRSTSKRMLAVLVAGLSCACAGGGANRASAGSPTPPPQEPIRAIPDASKAGAPHAASYEGRSFDIARTDRIGANLLGGYLAEVMDKYARNVAVYTDRDSPANHFLARGAMWGPRDRKIAGMMIEDHSGGCHSGKTCVKVRFTGRVVVEEPLGCGTGQPECGSALHWAMLSMVGQQVYGGLPCCRIARPWAGYVFNQGTMGRLAASASANWGIEPDAGIDLSGATALSFWARAEDVARAKFFALGTGRQHDAACARARRIVGGPGCEHRASNAQGRAKSDASQLGRWALRRFAHREARERVSACPKHPDSATEVTTGFVNLSSEWQKFSLDLRDRDLSYTIGGFGWVTNAIENRSRDVTFYLDDIIFEGVDWLNEPRFLESYQGCTMCSPSSAPPNAIAYTYDQAVAMIAFQALGDRRRASLIADALVRVILNDRSFSDGRPRKAYTPGRVLFGPGWEPTGKPHVARLPGSTLPNGRWLEDAVHASSYIGDAAWVVLTLARWYEELRSVGGEATTRDRYRQVAAIVGNWIDACCRDERGTGGYTAGYEGADTDQRRLLHKSTEQNTDAAVAFERLFLLYGDPVWKERSDHARQFVESMWNSEEGTFWSGTTSDGTTHDSQPISVGALARIPLAFPDWADRFAQLSKVAEGRYAVPNGGFDYDTDRDGTWYEGTAQMAVLYKTLGREERWRSLVSVLRHARSPDGGLPAASRDGLTTGHNWTYPLANHVGASSWAVLAELGVNPYARVTLH